LFADGARILEVTGADAREVPRPARQFYLASNGSTGIGLAVDPVTGAISGYASKGGGRLQIAGDFLSGLQFEEIAEAEDQTISCGNGEHDLSPGASPVEAGSTALSASAAAAGAAITYQAVVAVDTDNEWLDGFGNNRNLAMDWITDLFLAMNVLYERDVETRLLIGDVFLRVRTDPDPYSLNPDTFAKLNEFGEYWMENMDDVDRQFAAMFSGRNVSPGWFSGIAWIEQYCDYGRSINGGTAVIGSYSYNAIGAGFPAAAAAHYVGHELGHNMGSPHTHCYPSPIDQCHSGETYRGNACYSGNAACPADGAGTVMSYCHNLANCDSDTEFHPTVQALLEDRLASELVAGCISPYIEANPTAELQSAPSAGALLEFGGQVVGTTSPAQAIEVQNIGTANLTLSCTLSGPGQAAFDIASCASTVVPAGTADVAVACAPGAVGLQQAVLTLLTNDPDETAVDFELNCNGLAPPADVISHSSFEN
jgi:hypothetical protein